MHKIASFLRKTKIERIFLRKDKLLDYFKFIPKSLSYTASETRYYLTHDVHHMLSAYIDIKLNISQNIKLNISQDMRLIKKNMCQYTLGVKKTLFHYVILLIRVYHIFYILITVRNSLYKMCKI